MNAGTPTNPIGGLPTDLSGQTPQSFARLARMVLGGYATHKRGGRVTVSRNCRNASFSGAMHSAAPSSCLSAASGSSSWHRPSLT